MGEARDFDFYFNDEKLEADKLERMRLVREIVQELYPDVQERVSNGMPGFYPKKATEDNQQLFLVKANEESLDLYGIEGMDEEDIAPFVKQGVSISDGSVKVPYDFSKERMSKLLQFLMKYNFQKVRLELMH